MIGDTTSESGHNSDDGQQPIELEHEGVLPLEKKKEMK